MGPPFSSAIAVPWGNRSHGDQNSVSWLVSAHPGEGSQRLQLLNMGLGQLVAAHGELLNGDELFPFRFSTVSMAAASPRPWTVVNGGSRPFSVTLNLVASDS